MEDWHGKLNMTKVSRTDLCILIACCAEVVAIDSTKARVTKAILARAMVLFILDKRSQQFAYNESGVILLTIVSGYWI